MSKRTDKEYILKRAEYVNLAVRSHPTVVANYIINLENEIARLRNKLNAVIDQALDHTSQPSEAAEWFANQREENIE